MRLLRPGARALALVASLGLVGAVLTAASVPASAVTASPSDYGNYSFTHAIRQLSGCESSVLPANDDNSSGVQTIGFPINFFGVRYDNVFVNNNGNLTFDVAHSDYVPSNLYTITRPLVAAFFSDVDTRGTGTIPVHYGSGTTSTGQKYFCADYIKVGEYSGGTVPNSFQILLFDDSGAPGGTAGDFTIELNYDSVLWDHNNARAGFAGGNGQSGSSIELPGSGVAGALRDNGPNALIASSANSSVLGRYRYSVNHQGPLPTGVLTGTVTNDATPAVPLDAARVQACNVNNFCRTTLTNANGQYQVNGLQDGLYRVTAFPPGNEGTQAQGQTNVVDRLGSLNLQLHVPQPLPPGTTVGDSNGNTVIGGVSVPVIYWGTAHPITVVGCEPAQNPAVTLDVANDFSPAAGYHTVFPLAAGDPAPPVGTSARRYYSAVLPVFHDLGVHGVLTLTFTFNCGTPFTFPTITIYIDPSGRVISPSGAAISGATVTLLRSDDQQGPFVAVPDGSSLMSPTNRANPSTTDGLGRYGWDVVAGYYRVQASKAGCHAVGGTGPALSDVLNIPPAVTGLDLVLDCGTPVTAPTITCPPRADATVGAAPTPAILGTPSVTGGGTTLTASPAAVVRGLNTVTWTVTNSAGSATCGQRVNGYWLYSASGVVPFASNATAVTLQYTLRNAPGVAVPPAGTVLAVSYTTAGSSTSTTPGLSASFNSSSGLTSLTMAVPSSFGSAAHVVTLKLTDNSTKTVNLPAVTPAVS